MKDLRDLKDLTIHDVKLIRDESSLSRSHQPSEWEKIVVFETPDLYHRSPDSGELQ